MTNPAVPAALAVLEAINTGDLDLINGAVTDSFVDHSAPFPMPPGPEGYRRALTFVTQVLKIRYTLEELFANDDRIVVRATAYGRGVEFVHGPGSTDKPFAMSTLHIYATEGDRLSEHWSERDELGVRRQVGTWPRLDGPAPEAGSSP